MSLLQIELNQKNSERAGEISRRLGKSPAELVNDAVERYLADAEGDATEPDWKTAIMQAAGMWKDRDDLPDFEEIRRSMSRNVWAR
jgi:hypothetical protein